MSQSTSPTTDDEPIMVTQDIDPLSQIEKGASSHCELNTTLDNDIIDSSAKKGVSSPNKTTTQPKPKQVSNIMDPSNQHPKIKEKMKSAITHFNCYLNTKNSELVANSLPVTV